MEKNDITNLVFTVDGVKFFRLIVGDHQLEHYNELLTKAQDAEVEPIIVTDDGNDDCAWWEDDSAFVFDIIASKMTDRYEFDWPEGLFEFSEKLLDTDAYAERQEFSVNGHTLVVEPDYSDLASVGKVCGLD